ncbi:MAG: phosphatidylglycerophosphatase A [Syntrophorhabdales bacterium]
MTRDRICEWFATCCYVGYLPAAPGTWGSLLAGILLYLFPFFHSPIVILFLLAGGVATAQVARGDQGDPGYVVIDEFAGMVITMAGHAVTFRNLFIGFILFRAFDILKPYPVRKLERLPGAYGIIADDVLAGILASAALFVIGRIL